MLNLFALRSKNPKMIFNNENPIGLENDLWIKKMAERSKIIVIAWGSNGKYKGRDLEIFDLLEGKVFYHFGLTKNGSPKHPLYLPNDSILMPFIK